MFVVTVEGCDPAGFFHGLGPAEGTVELLRGLWLFFGRILLLLHLGVQITIERDAFDESGQSS